MWKKLRCGQCERVLLIKNTFLDDMVMANEPPNCPSAGCFGLMSTFGQEITRARTASLKQGYESVVHRKSLKRSAPPVNYCEDVEVDQAIKSKKKKKLDPDELEYLLPAEFSPELRLTEQDAQNVRALAAPGAYPFIKDSSIVPVGNAIPGERAKQTKGAMGQRSAWKHALDSGAPNAGKYTVGGKSHYEWCHLHGDSLGGSCTASNLVAAHYAANTFMMTIESVLKAKGHFSIQVIAYCLIPDVADFIEYHIFDTLSGKHKCQFVIDAQMTAFSKSDYSNIKAQLKQFGIK